LGRKQLRFDRNIFLDRTHGGRFVTLLRDVGFMVNPIKEIYPNGKDQFIRDPDWIRLCGERNWVVVTGDKRLETVPENRQAVIDAKARVFILMDTQSLPEEWAAAVIVGQERMQEILEANSGPFFVNISKRTGSHIARLRLPLGYERPPRLFARIAPGDAQPKVPESPGASQKPKM
jgi:hypothetical protein